MKTRPCFRLLPLLFAMVTGGVAACASPGELEPDLTLQEGMPPRYLAGFESLREAVIAGEDRTARRIAGQLRVRLDQEPPGASLRSVEKLLEGFEKVLKGRELVDATRLWLALETEGDSQTVRVTLHGQTGHASGVLLNPGAASLRLQRTVLMPDGQEQSSVRTFSIMTLEPLTLGDTPSPGIELHSYDAQLPVGALAASSVWTLHLRSGDVQADGQSYPAMRLAAASVERVDLAGILPNAAVEPAELARAAAAPLTSLPALLERTVRIVPERRDEALDLLTPLIAGWTPEQVERLVPSLRWLSRGTDAGRDPLAWRAWLRARSDHRQAPGSRPGEAGPASPQLDFSRS